LTASPESLFLTAHDGQTLHVAHYAPPGGKGHGVIVGLHGACEHGARQRPLAEALVAEGWRVMMVDLRGHGRSGGPRGGVTRDDDMLYDLATVLDDVVQRWPGERRVVFGFSTGGGVSVRFAAELISGMPPESRAAWSRPIDGLVLACPVFRPALGMIQKALLTSMGRLMQDMPLPVIFRAEWLNSDPVAIAEYRADTLAHRLITPRLALFIEQQGDVTLSRAAQWTVPTQLLTTPRDRMISLEACERFAGSVPPALMTSQTFPDLLHDMLREPGRGQVFEAVGRWLSATFGVPRGAAP
jgi:alpha-beta hydrolase superfamily lysophospholipase